MGPADCIEPNTGAKPKQMVADGGFTNRENVLGMNEKGIDFIGPRAVRPTRQRAALSAARSSIRS